MPRTYQSGKRVYHGRLIKQSNKYLKWAFIESATSSIRSSVYFRGHYERIRKNKGTQAGIISTARKLATVVYKILKEKRGYKEIYKDNIAGSPSHFFNAVRHSCQV